MAITAWPQDARTTMQSDASKGEENLIVSECADSPEVRRESAQETLRKSGDYDQTPKTPRGGKACDKVVADCPLW
eukprot:CAMPEP_0119303872 /NCGR_PEP_ID=MMETSP1333-20130426/5235_1 /TAXON_ID=418940 /ORGANISM="Scyphosphaera apsteinii, Strain RCC1455" /LENGTH=74 /DNA_ID=CAMNT_0007306643 /DNA_START=363 /DNA_END=584 /DNA_ORIENTATION=-